MAFEDVQIAHGVNHNKQDQQDGGTCQAQTIIGDFDVFGRENGGTNFLSKKIRRTEVPPRYVSKKKGTKIWLGPLKTKGWQFSKGQYVACPFQSHHLFFRGLSYYSFKEGTFFFQFLMIFRGLCWRGSNENFARQIFFTE